MKLIALSFLILLTSCLKNSGGVIVNNTEPTVSTTNNGPYGGQIENDEVIPLPTVYDTNYNSFDLEQKIALANSGDTIIIDKNIDLNYPVQITKPIKIKALNKNINITGINLVQMFNIEDYNVEFEGFNFYMYNILKLINTQLDLMGKPIYGNVILKNNKFYLSGKSQIKIYGNDISFLNNTIFGLTTIDRDLFLLDILGNNINIYSNNIFDMNKHYSGGLLISRSNLGNIKDNFIWINAKKLNAAISLDEVQNYNIEDNRLYDSNSTRIKNNGFTEDINIDGSIAISIKNSSNIFNNGKTNYYYASHSLLTDEGDVNGSSNIQMLNNTSIPYVVKESLFNNISSEDYTPICLIGLNPTISLTTIQTGQNYIMENNSILYYTGAIKPACL